MWAEWKGSDPLADGGNVEGWRIAINGGQRGKPPGQGGPNGLEDVRKRYAAALRVA